MATHWKWFIYGALAAWAWATFFVIPPHHAGLAFSLGMALGITLPGAAVTLAGAGIGRAFGRTQAGIYVAGPLALIGTLLFGLAFNQFHGL